MKKIVLPVVIVILAAAAFFAFGNKGSKNPAPAGSNTSSTDTSDIAHNEMDDMASTTPPAAPPSGTPAPSPTPPATQDDIGDVDVAPPKVFSLTGRNFSFSQNEIRVKKGDRVVINFTSTDGLHDWVIDEFNARTDRVNTGVTATAEFIADKTGTFEYYCSVSVHRAAGMKGNLIVE